MLLRRIFKIKCFLIILLFVVLATFVNCTVFYLLMPGPLTSSKTLIIEPKLSVAHIVTKLYDNGVIKYPLLFRAVSMVYAITKPLKSGEYTFTHNISPLQILKILVNGESIIHKLFIPEGSTVSEIINKINIEPRLVGEIKGIIPEGYLMPSTYFFSYGDQRQHLIDRMRRLMSKNLDQVMTKLSPNSPLKTRLDVLILASIVEKEAGFDYEKPMIAAVFVNRLVRGMKLQADPTTIYAITEGKFKLNRRLTRRDLSLESLHNTYYISGLPPGAICCPSLTSLEAVVNPAKIDSLFFVVNGKGGHNFSNNLRDHNQFVDSYRRSLKKTPIIELNGKNS